MLIAANSWGGNGAAPGGSGGNPNGGAEATPAAVAVPKNFLGAWEGVPLSDTRVRVEFKKDEQHRTVARSFFLTGTSLCVVNKAPKKASKGSVSLGEARSENAFGGGKCTFLPSYTLKTRKDGNLDFATDNGQYKAVLFKARAGTAPVPEKYVGQWVPKGEKENPTAQVTIEQAKTGDFFVRGWDNSPRKHCAWQEVLVFVNDTGLISRPVYRRGSADPCGIAPTGARGYTLMRLRNSVHGSCGAEAGVRPQARYIARTYGAPQVEPRTVRSQQRESPSPARAGARRANRELTDTGSGSARSGSAGSGSVDTVVFGRCQQPLPMRRDVMLSLKCEAMAASDLPGPIVNMHPTSRAQWRYVAVAISTKDRINGLASPSFHAATTRLGAMSISGTTANSEGRSCPNGASPTVPFHNTACRHS